MNIYIAGPISSVGGNFNVPLFDFVAKKLRALGHEVYNPIDLSRQMYGLDKIHKMSKQEQKGLRGPLLAKELAWICHEADALFMLPGWRQSGGACVEHKLAEYLGLLIKEAPDVILMMDAAKADDVVMSFDIATAK